MKRKGHPPMIILGVDPGTQITGYGIIESRGSSIVPLDYGCIRPPAKLPLPERYRIIFESLETLIATHKPSVLAIESQFVLKNAQSAIKLGMAKGMAILAASRHGLAVFEYAPKKAKLAVTGTGQASKWQVQKMIQSLLRLSAVPEPEDAADALALAICHAQRGDTPCTNRSEELLQRKRRRRPSSIAALSPTD